MKKSIVWVVLLAGVVTTFNSCDKAPDPPHILVGTWSRLEYEFTELPSTYSSWEEFTIASLGESGYTFVFKADGTYTRSFTRTFNSLNDQGTWVLDGTKLTIAPDDADDLTDIEDIGFVGPEFDVEGEITQLRLVLSGTTSFLLCSDAAIEAAGGDTNNVPDEDANENQILDAGEDENENGVLDDEWEFVDVKLLTKFNRLN